ncbi:hypothetical protein ACWFR5_44445 [Streptomyces sp. NPDC055092]
MLVPPRPEPVEPSPVEVIGREDAYTVDARLLNLAAQLDQKTPHQA